MENIKHLFKKFEEKEESDYTSQYESESKEKISPQFAKMIEEELIFTQRESTKLGNSVENYFYLKLKKCLKANEDFTGFYSISMHIQKIKDGILRYVKEKTKIESKEADQIKIAGFNLIKRAEDIFPTNSKKIQIDSFFPNICGKNVKTFYAKVDEYSYSSKNFINSIKDENYYNLIVESTHCITSNLNRKRKQFERYFRIFNLTKKLYMENQEMLKQFYVDFLKYFKILDNVNAEQISHEELIGKSNFIYILCSNKNYYKTKLFQESMHDKAKFEELVKELLSLEKNEADANEDIKQNKKAKNRKSKESNAKKKYDNDGEEDPKDCKESQNKEDSKDGKVNNNEVERERFMEGKSVNYGEDLKQNLQGKKDRKKCEKDQAEKENLGEIHDDYRDEETKKKGNNSITENTEDEESDINLNDDEEEKEYNPRKYLISFKKILNWIQKENEHFLLIYLDSYDRLFVPYSIIKDGLISLNQKYENLQKDYNGLISLNKNLEKDYNDLKKKTEENNEILMRIRDSHPEFFETKTCYENNK